MTAYNLILQNKEKVEAIADKILEEKEIYGDDLVRLLDEQKFERPEIDWTDESVWPKFMNYSRRQEGRQGQGRPAGGVQRVSDEAEAPDRSSPVPDTIIKPTGRYKLRFALIYGGLAAIGIAAIVGLVVLVAKPSSSSGSVSAKGWSDWKPDSGTTGQMATQIAQHVAREYKLNKAGAPLLAVVAGPPQVTSGTHNIAVSNIAVKKTAASAAGIEVVPSASTWKEQLCGIGGAGCSIPTGKPSETRGRLVRREALEIALYTFKFVPAIKSIVAFMPPPAGSAALDAPLPPAGGL